MQVRTLPAPGRRLVPDQQGIAERVARPAVMAFALAFAVTTIWATLRAHWSGGDMSAYWEAAIRLRGGQPLYVPHANLDDVSLYRYAPWFAWAWIPLTSLPREVVEVGWRLAMIGCSCLAVWPVLRTRTQEGVALALLTWPMMIYVSVSGNVHAALVAGLVYGVRTRWGPTAIAIAASLKAVPLAFALVYLGRRQYGRFALTLGLTAALVAPMLFHDLSDYTTNPGAAVLLTGWLWFVVVGVGCATTVLLARTRYGWLSAATTTVLAFPRWFLYDVSLILAAMPATRSTERSRTPLAEQLNRH